MAEVAASDVVTLLLPPSVVIAVVSLSLDVGTVCVLVVVLLTVRVFPVVPVFDELLVNELLGA